MRIILTFVTSILLFTGTYSQQANIGVQASTNINILSWSGEAYNGIGFNGGISVPIALGEKWSIRPELNFQIRRISTKSEETFTSSNYQSTSTSINLLSYNYLEFPVIFSYKSKHGFGFHLGPQFGSMISMYNEYTSTYEETFLTTGEVNESHRTGIEKEEAPMIKEISILLGPSYNFDFGLSVEVRVQRSVLWFNRLDPSFETAWSVVSLGIRYELPIRKYKID